MSGYGSGNNDEESNYSNSGKPENSWVRYAFEHALHNVLTGLHYCPDCGSFFEEYKISESDRIGEVSRCPICGHLFSMLNLNKVRGKSDE